VQAALERRGVAVTGLAWNGDDQRFADFDAVIFRSNWDYHHSLDAFIAWLDRLDATGVPVWNPTRLVRWNLSKRYLLELAGAGVPTVPTVVLEGDAAAQLPRVLAQRGWTSAIVKPIVSASAHGTTLIRDGHAAPVVAALADGSMRQPVLVQPFVEEIVTRGEWSVVFIDGAVTHTVLKRPGPGDFRVQPSHGGSAEALAAPADVLAAAHRAVAALPVPPLYARIDGVQTREGFAVMEVEVHEPGLAFTLAPSAADQFAEAIVRRLGR
jgi:glutathione synthase/RimK-type ligase-like ATP-grasp enzyme